MESDYILAIDQGTTGSTAVLLDDRLNVLAQQNREFEQIYPKPSWVEHEPEVIWNVTLDTIRDVLRQADIAGDEISAIGITNQRETTVVWDKKTGEPIHNAIVWQDRRTADRTERLKEQGKEEWIHNKTGLLLDPYFSGTKLEWLLEESPGVRARAERGELAFGTIDTFLLWRLTGGDTHATDVSNASRTLLMNLEDSAWDSELLDEFNIPESMLASIRGNAEVYGKTNGVDCLPDGIPISGMAGDQQAALFGQVCFEQGEGKCTYGTGAFLLMNTGTEPVFSEHGLLTSAAWSVGDETIYMLEGSAFTSGAAVQWLRDGLGIIDEASEVEALANRADTTDGTVFVPALSGLGAPHWKPAARGKIAGLTRGTKASHIARACLEGIALQNVDLVEAMEADLGEKLTELKVDGGASENDLLMQIQSDLLDRRIVRPELTQTTAIGAALLAGLGSGIFAGYDELRRIWSEDAKFYPDMSESHRSKKLQNWRHEVEKL